MKNNQREYYSPDKKKNGASPPKDLTKIIAPWMVFIEEYFSG